MEYISIDFEELKKSILEQVDGCFRLASEQLKERIGKLIDTYARMYDVVESPKPVPPSDPAVKWLYKTLRQVKKKHPELEYFFRKNREDMIVALYYRAPDEEVARDVERPARWAFRVASERRREG